MGNTNGTNAWLYNIPAVVSVLTGGMAMYAGTLLPEKHQLVRTYLYLAGGLNMLGGATQLAVAPSISRAVAQAQASQGPPVVIDVAANGF